MKAKQQLIQDQRLVMNMAMERAFAVLQMPTLELKEWLETEIEQNPLLELERTQSSWSDFSGVESRPTLYEILNQQIPLYYETLEEQEAARWIAGNLDENGFFEQEVLSPFLAKVLETFHTMEPLGIGAHSPQHALILQSQDPCLDQLLTHHYDDLLHQRLNKMTKELKISEAELKKLIHDKLRPLNPFPGRCFHPNTNSSLEADLIIQFENDRYSVEICHSLLPSFHISPYYLKRLESKNISKEEIHTIRRYLAAGKWLERIMSRREKTLYEIGLYLIEKQRAFLEGSAGTPKPMTMKQLAEDLGLSNATIHRTVSQKAIFTPRGLMKLRDFFTQEIVTPKGTISNQAAKNLLLQLISQEKHPLTDAALANLMAQAGIPCARRTIAKYRKELNIGPASQRKLRNY